MCKVSGKSDPQTGKCLWKQLVGFNRQILKVAIKNMLK